MSYLIICTVALAVSGLTLFSGFGLGTLLMPVFALFFSGGGGGGCHGHGASSQ